MSILRPLFSRVLAAVALGAVVFAQDLHKDPRLGFQLRVPRGWQQIPVRSDEGWIVGKYRAPKAERSVDPTSGYSLKDYPELLIVAILHESTQAPAEKEVEGTEGTEGDTGKDEVVSKPMYRDYKEYLRENYSHGHFVEKEEMVMRDDLRVTQLEIKAERDLNFSEKRILTWVYEAELADIAVHLEVPAESYRKFSSAVLDTLRSFKVIPRTEDLHSNAAPAALSKAELAKLTPAERKERRIEVQNQAWERMSRDLPEGWSAKELDGVYVLNHVDDRFAKKVVEQVRAVYAWLDETFPEVGPHEHARLPIVRICESSEEESAFRKGSGTYWVGGTELVTHKGTRAESWEWEYISGRALQIWLLERAPELRGAMPRWLAVGLREVVESSRVKSGKLVFGMGDYEKFTREGVPRDSLDSLTVQTLVSLSDEEFNAFGKRGDWAVWCQAISLTRYFVDARSKKRRELLISYLNNLQIVLAEMESKDPEKEDEKEPENEEEEERLIKEREKWLEARERAIIDRTIQLTFNGWTSANWKSLEREFRRSQ